MNMDKDVARSLSQFANSRRAVEHHKWVNMPSRAKEAEVEAQRLRVAAWATAVNQLYSIVEQQSQQEENTNGIRSTIGTQNHGHEAAGQDLPTTSHEAAGHHAESIPG